MPTLTTDDGVKLYYEETGSGTPIVFVHEFAGDYRSWEPQVRHFSRRYRCITYNARGYPPSDVPPDVDRYSQQRARDDILSVLDALGIERAHVVGHFHGRRSPRCISAWPIPPRALSLVVAGCGYGAHPTQYAQFQEQSRALAKTMLEEGMAQAGGDLRARPRAPAAAGPRTRAASPSSSATSRSTRRKGSANTMLGYQARRPSLYDLTAEMARITAPLLIVAGDEDDATLEPSLLMKRTIPDGRARGAAQERPHAQPGGAGAVQPPAGGLLPPGRGRALDARA